MGRRKGILNYVIHEGTTEWKERSGKDGKQNGQKGTLHEVPDWRIVVMGWR